MRVMAICIFSVFSLASCVSRKKYNALETRIKTAEKTRAKLEVKKTDLEKLNIKLADSAERMR